MSTPREAILLLGSNQGRRVRRIRDAVDRLSRETELLALAKRLEVEAGRRGGARWGPRTLDVDILLLGDAVIDLPGLVIPHAAMALRRFCLRPAADVASGAMVPTYGRTVSQLLDACEDPLEVIAL